MEYKLAPIVLFVYKRPWHTLQTLNSLANNLYSDKSTLYIYCDGPKEDASEEDRQNIKEVRRIIRQRKWCKEVIIIEREKNKGLANSVIEGVTEVVNKHGKIIVLEDDLVLSPGFLKYMNEALELYEDEEKVMHISGYMFPVKAKLPETFFLPVTSCWGWGTWKRAWDNFNFNIQTLYNTIASNEQFVERFNLNYSYDYFKNFKKTIEGQINSWAIVWYASVFLKDGLCLHPGISLVRNIGFDEQGTHCNNVWYANKYSKQKIAKEVIINKKNELKISYDIVKLLEEFYNSLKVPPFYLRVFFKVKYEINKKFNKIHFY